MYTATSVQEFRLFHCPTLLPSPTLSSHNSNNSNNKSFTLALCVELCNQIGRLTVCLPTVRHEGIHTYLHPLKRNSKLNFSWVALYRLVCRSFVLLNLFAFQSVSALRERTWNAMAVCQPNAETHRLAAWGLFGLIPYQSNGKSAICT